MMGTEALVRFQSRFRTEQLGLLRRQLGLERQVAALVEEAYGLTPEERRLLRETRPVRDPLDVLESRIAGKGSGEVPAAEQDKEH